MSGQRRNATARGAMICLALAFVVSFGLKAVNLRAGAPFVTIDDNSTFEGGFLVWFGNAPPQRMYLESWLCGVTNLVTYVARVLSHQTATGLGSNLVADAYQDYYGTPDAYVYAYRWFVLLLDMVTAWLVYRLALLVLDRKWLGWGAVLAAISYLLSYNTVWCDLVARPDVIVSFFTVSGLFFYYRSEFGARQTDFWLAAILLGLGGGLKLHACFFVVFIVLDLIRVHGWRGGIRRAAPWALVAVVCFAWAAGTLVFDPLKYVKLRLTNMADDESPWIQWGEQFWVLVKGSGWLVLPGILVGGWRVFFARAVGSTERERSVFFVALCWLVLFGSIRQLRGYWMVPVLPLFYIAFFQAWQVVKSGRWRWGTVVVLLLAMAVQTIQESRAFGRVEFNSLRSWIEANVAPEQPLFIYGYQALELPKNEACLAATKQGLERGLADDLARGEPHVVRHLKNWEEETALTLTDMLAGRRGRGFTYYSVFKTPLEKFKGIISLSEMAFILVQDGFDPAAYGLADAVLTEQFELRATLTGPGGGGRGLGYRVYERKVTP